jgi:hypothetical protein
VVREKDKYRNTRKAQAEEINLRDMAIVEILVVMFREFCVNRLPYAVIISEEENT